MTARAEFVLKVAKHPINSDSKLARTILLGQVARADQDELVARGFFTTALKLVTNELGRSAITDEDKGTLSDLAQMLRQAIHGQSLEFVVRGPEA